MNGLLPRCGERWLTIDGPAAHYHTCIRQPPHTPPPAHLCACGATT